MAGILKVDKYQDFNGNDIMTSDGAGNITLSSNMNTAVAAGSNNTPAFFVRRQDQSITEDSFVKIIFSTEDIDTDSAFDTATGRFTVPSGKAGKYYFSTTVGLDAMGANHFYYGEIKFYKNGSALSMNSSLNYANGYGAQGSVALSTIQDLSVGDYIEIYAYLDDAVDTTVKVNNACFSGYKIIGT